MVVVALTPQRQLVSSVGQTEEDLHVQALVAQSAVEALDVTLELDWINFRGPLFCLSLGLLSCYFRNKIRLFN